VEGKKTSETRAVDETKVEGDEFGPGEKTQPGKKRPPGYYAKRGRGESPRAKKTGEIRLFRKRGKGGNRSKFNLVFPSTGRIDRRLALT